MYNKFSEIVHDLRKRCNYTQEEFGLKLGVSNKTISKWEIGEVIPDISTIISLTDVFRFSLIDMLSELTGEDILLNNYSDSKSSIMEYIGGKHIKRFFICGCIIMLATNMIVLFNTFFIGIVNLLILTAMLVCLFIRFNDNKE